MKPFHLVRAHADVIEEDVDSGCAQRRKDVHVHPVEGQEAAADEGHDHYQGRDGTPHGEDRWIHSSSSESIRGRPDVGVSNGDPGQDCPGNDLDTVIRPIAYRVRDIRELGGWTGLGGGPRTLAVGVQ